MFRRSIICFSSTLKNVRHSHISKNNEALRDLKINALSSFRDGDDGYSYLLSGEKLPKDHHIFHTIGTFEELNSVIGFAREFAQENEHEYVDKLKRVQMCIIDIMTGISNNAVDNPKIVPDLYTKELEEWITEYDRHLPPAEHFIMPGGGKACSSLHVARCCCRKAERYVVTLIREGAIDKGAQIYLNRLADFLFVISRLAAKKDKRSESIYIPTPQEKQQPQ